GSGDVHALMEREAAVPVQERAVRGGAVELHAGIAEVRADEVLAVERLDRVAEAVARGRLRDAGPGRLGDLRPCGKRARERERRACCDRDRSREQELRDAAPCAANWMRAVGSHAATVRR